MDSAHNNEEKIADDQPSYNFIDRFPDIYEHIFGYLDNESLLEALLVCTSWSEFICQSSKLMMKTKVYFCITPIRPPYTVIETWKRKIIHLKVGYLLGPEDRTIDLLNGNAPILQHLTSLDISVANLNTIKHVLVTKLSLKNLKVTCRESTEEDWNELAVGFENIVLKALSIKLMGFLRESVGVERFLGTQMQLEELEIRVFISSALMEMITQMERLKDLTIHQVFGRYDQNIVGFMPSLERLKVDDEPLINFDQRSFDPIINSTSNLTEIYIQSLNQAWIDSNGLKLKKLKKLHARSLYFLENISNPDLFPALEEVKVKDRFRFYFRNRIRRALAGESTNFKRCLYEELNNDPHNYNEHYEWDVWEDQQ